MITALNYLVNNDYFRSDEECANRILVDARVSKSKILQAYDNNHYVKITSKWAIYHAYIDNQLKLFNLKRGQAFNSTDLKEHLKSRGDLRKFFEMQEVRSYVMLAHYYPETLIMKPQVHAITAKYARKEKSYILYGLSNGTEDEPIIVNDCAGELILEFKKMRTIQILIPEEYITSKHDFWENEKRAAKYKLTPTERMMVNEMFIKSRRDERAATARKA